MHLQSYFLDWGQIVGMWVAALIEIFLGTVLLTWFCANLLPHISFAEINKHLTEQKS